jgi:two-component system, NarL family, sensor histidine kinase UhpB
MANSTKAESGTQLLPRAEGLGFLPALKRSSPWIILGVGLAAMAWTWLHVMNSRSGEADLAIVVLVMGSVASIALFAVAWVLRHVHDLVDKTLTNAQASSQENDGQLSGIIRSANDAIITIDEAQNIVLFNAAAERIFHCPADDVMGTPLLRLLPHRFQNAHGAHITRFRTTGVSERQMGRQRALFGVRSGGEEFPIEASISQFEHDGRHFYTVILRDISLRKKAEQELIASQKQLRELSAYIQTAREEEKNHIARELHDDLGQQLTALKMDLSELESMLGEGSTETREKTAGINALVNSTVASVRRISADLRPAMLDDLGLAAAIEWLTEDFSRRYGIEVKLELGHSEVELVGPAATAVFRMIQEALTNVARHAGASRVGVAIGQSGDRLVTEIRDNGKGISQEDQSKHKSFGLIGMKERAHLLGGDVEISALPGLGTRILITVPLSQQRVGEQSP